MLSLVGHLHRIQSISEQTITPSLIVSLRREVGEQLAQLLLEIASLQAKAKNKFGHGIWMATERSLQQASDRVVADYKASLFGDHTVIDLCGGIGGDAMALARRGAVVTVDLDPQMTNMAAANLRAIAAQNAVAVCADARDYFRLLRNHNHSAAIHIDPDRRPAEQRVSDPEMCSPSLSMLATLIEARDAAIVKLAPAAVVEESIAAKFHRQWISFAGSVREQSLLSGGCRDVSELLLGNRSAIRVFQDGRRELYVNRDKHVARMSMESASRVGQFIIDFDPAIRAAGLSGPFAADRELKPLGESSGFHTTDDMPRDRRLMQCFEVLWTGPADRKQIRAQLASRQLSIEVVKVRGTDHEPEMLRSQLRSKSNGESVTLLIGRTANGIYAVIANPVERNGE